jgi:MFS family permease
MASSPEKHSEGAARKSGPVTFALIFSLESLVRSLNSTVLSLQAYDILGSSQRVSLLSTVIALAVLATTLFLPQFLKRLPKRYAYAIGIGLMINASIALSTHTLVGQGTGMFMRNCGAAIMNITLAIYILEHIKRSELTRSEPLRLSLSTFSWMIGPAFGVWLYDRLGPAGPQAVAIVSAAVLLAVFWHLRLHEAPVSAVAARSKVSAWQNIRQFNAQPRLRLAWLIAFGRSMFWTTFFIYGPIMMVEAGLPKTYGGLLASGSQVLLLSAYLFGRVAQVHGVRIVVALAFAIGAIVSIAAGIAGVQQPYLASGLLLIGALAASALDGVGGIPFMRAVKPHERQRMTPVYRTYIDFSELIPAFLFSLALLQFGIGVVFIIMGLGLAVIGALSWRYLPRSM